MLAVKLYKQKLISVKSSSKLPQRDKVQADLKRKEDALALANLMYDVFKEKRSSGSK
jgi:hypothetical protein